jgi:ATP-dependent DNA ligase
VPAMRAYFVSCPITLYPATSASERLSFRQINRRTGHRVKHMLVDSVTGEAVDAANKARGYDLLYLNGHDLRKLPLFQRKAQLKKIVAETDVQFSESFEVDGTEMYQHACKTGLEGVVTKVRDSRYNSGRANNWVKKTCAQRETLAIAGYALDGRKFDGLFGQTKGRGVAVRRQGRSWFRSCIGKGIASAPKAADPKDAALYQADRASRNMGRTIIACRNRIPREIRGRQSSPSCL